MNVVSRGEIKGSGKFNISNAPKRKGGRVVGNILNY